MADALPDPLTPRTYVIVWAALIGLATLTLLTSLLLGGTWGLLLAFAIAATKAFLVAAHFMHLAHGRPVLRLIFALGLAFIALLILGVLGDITQRPTASPYVDDLGSQPAP